MDDGVADYLARRAERRGEYVAPVWPYIRQALLAALRGLLRRSR